MIRKHRFAITGCKGTTNFYFCKKNFDFFNKFLQIRENIARGGVEGAQMPSKGSVEVFVRGATPLVSCVFFKNGLSDT